MADIERPDTIGAHRRAETIREGMRSWVSAREAIAEAFAANDWMTLGYNSWDQYCEKEFSAKKLRLTAEERLDAALAFRDVGMTLREIGAATGTSGATVHRLLNPKPVSDETTPSQVTPVGESADDEPETAATEEGVPPVAAPTAVDDAPIISTSTDGDEGFHSPDDSPAGDGPGAERPVPGNPQDSPTGRDPEAQPEPPVVATTGRSGDDTPAAAVDQVALVAQQPGPIHPEPDPGGPVERNAPGIPSPSFEGSDNGDGLEEGRDLRARPSSSDPSTVVQMFRGWVETVDDLDPDALGPLLDDGDMKTLHRCVDDLAHFVGLLERWRTP